MSSDRGDAPISYTNNFAYGTIELAPGTNLILVDNDDNAPGAEGLYVNSLIVPAGSTLDLRDFNVYARATQIDGSVIGGLINPVADGGAISFAQPYLGQILNIGETDEWTFFGRAGRGLSLTLNPGTSGQLTPLPPALNFAAVEVIKPDGSMLISVDNTLNGAGSVLNLLSVTLPTDGSYTIRVTAPPSQPDATGRYAFIAYDSTVETNPLMLGQQVAGAIENAYAVDRWNFSTTANTRVMFDLINVSNPSVVFTLTGPEGYNAFNDSNADSDLIVLPTDGQYTLAVRGLGTATGNYAFKMTTNELPTADAGGPYLVLSGQTLELDGSDSGDADQDPATLVYEWDLDGDGVFESSGVSPVFDATILTGPSAQTVTLRVTDAGGLASLDTATVGVTPEGASLDWPDQIGSRQAVSDSGWSVYTAADGSVYVGGRWW